MRNPVPAKPGASESGPLKTAVDWYIDGDRIALRLPSGDTVYPTASEIIGAEYKGRLTIRGEAIVRRPSEALSDVRFARFPLDIRLRVIPPSEDLAIAPSCAIEIGKGARRAVAAPPSDADQVLAGGEWFPIARDVWEELQEILRTAGVAKPGTLTLKQYLELRRDNSELLVIGDLEKTDIEGATVATASTAMPVGLNAELYAYQRTGVGWLTRIADEGLGCVLGDEMGLGKTLQVITLLLRETPMRRPSLVVAPATLLENWRREIAKFAPTLSVVIHRGHERTGFPRELRKYDVVVTSYETAVRDVGMLIAIVWNVLVRVGGQAIMSPTAQRTIAMKQLPRRVGIAVSGTPVENTLRDLWSVMDFAVPGLLGDLKAFESRFTDRVDDAEALEPIVTPLILRRRVADVATDLPERIDIPQVVELSAEAASRYDNIRAEIAAEYGAAATLVSLTKLRMFCAHPFLIDGIGGDPNVSTKFVRLLEILDEIFTRGEKVLIFTSYTGMADLLTREVSLRYHVPCSIIDGRTAVDDRQPTVDRFGQVGTSAALILNPKAAGTGLNITAANHVIHYNLEWNPAVEDQATARAYRRGQRLPVTVHRLFHAGTVEEVIDQRMQRKRSLAATAVIGTGGEAEDLADVMRALRLSPVLGHTDAH